MKNKTLSIATLLLTGALLFAGCGQTGNTTGNTSSTTAGQETATTEQTGQTVLHRLLPTALLPQMIFSRTWILQI